MTTTVVEMVTYKLKPQVTKTDLHTSHQGVNTFIKNQPGFLYRSVSADENDQWYDIVYWQDMESAKAAGDAFMASTEGQHLCSLVDMDSCFMRHMNVESEAMSCEGAS